MIVPLVIFGLPGLVVGLLVGRWWAVLAPVALGALTLLAGDGGAEANPWELATFVVLPAAGGTLTGVLVRAMYEAARDCEPAAARDARVYWVEPPPPTFSLSAKFARVARGPCRMPHAFVPTCARRARRPRAAGAARAVRAVQAPGRAGGSGR
jgi:hypothetical protein